MHWSILSLRRGKDKLMWLLPCNTSQLRSEALVSTTIDFHWQVYLSYGLCYPHSLSPTPILCWRILMRCLPCIVAKPKTSWNLTGHFCTARSIIMLWNCWDAAVSAKIHVFNVGGQWSRWTKWIHCFESHQHYLLHHSQQVRSEDDKIVHQSDCASWLTNLLVQV